MYPIFAQPTFNWIAQDRYEEVCKFKRTCTISFNGPVADLTPIKQASYVLLWLGEEGQEKHQYWPEIVKEACLIAHIWTQLFLSVGPSVSPLVHRLQLQESKQHTYEYICYFITRCRHLVSRCAYTSSKDALLDVLILSGISKAARDKLISSNVTTIDQALLIYQTDEAVNIYLTPLEPTINTVDKAPTKDTKSCISCGRQHDTCPALGARCSNCGRFNHWSSMCRTSRKTHAINTISNGYVDSRDEVFIRLTINQCRNNSINSKTSAQR